MKKTVTIILLTFLFGCNYPVSNSAKKIGDKVNKTCQVLSIEKSTKVAIWDDSEESSQMATGIIKLSVLERTVQMLTW